MKETMADRIKRLRIEAGMTQEELAEHLGTQKAIISKYESGRVSNLKRETIKKMADIFNVTPSYLMCFEDELPAKNIGNVSYPAAHAIPILGTICAGDGVCADENFDGFFFVDNSIRADCCLHVHGDSMEDAGIYDGILTNEDFTGFFFVDNSIKADYTLFVRGDSMVGAGINDGDIAFLSRNFEFEDGKIYGVVYGAEKECVLKKVYKQGETVILQPCNDSYKPIIVRADDVWIIGIVIGTYRGIN